MRGDHFAGTAPGGEEVDDEDAGFGAGGVEVGFARERGLLVVGP